MSLPCDDPGIPPGFDKTWPRVHVRNTFIEVDEESQEHADLTFAGLDLHNAPGRTWRRGHLRCASEPMSFFLSQPPWEPVSLNAPPFLPNGVTLTGDSRTAGAERGRAPCHRSQMTQMTIQESQEEYDERLNEKYERERLNDHSLPKYVGMKGGGEEGTPKPWCGEPMLVDVRSKSPGFTEDETRSSPEWSTGSVGSVPTLALPLRFRHARQRSRTIQEDAELAQNLDELDSDKVQQIPWDSFGERMGVNVRVRNTFIEVDEGSDGCTDPSVLSTWQRPGHLRCASEPIPYMATGPNTSDRMGFHSRSSSYQDDAEIALAHEDHLGQPNLTVTAHMAVDPEQRLGTLSDLSVGDTVSPVSLDASDGYNQHTSASANLKVSTPQCKWHSRGTCKYGDSCRFSHAIYAAKPSPSKSKGGAQRPSPPPGPLPAGLVPGGSTPFPVGVVSEAPKPAGLLPSGEPESSGRRCRSVSPVSTTAGSSAGEAEKAPSSQRNAGDKSHQVFWCDARAFKHEFQGFREELETAIGVAAKKCMRLPEPKLKKKQRAQAERGRRYQKARPLIFLVSWANAQELVEFLQEAQHMPPMKVVVLCDTNGPRTRAAAERWAKEMPVVETVAATWPEAVKAVQSLLSSSSSLSHSQGNA